MKIKSSLVLIAGMSLASITLTQAATTNLMANGSWWVSNASTSGTRLLYILGDIQSSNAIKANYFGATGECDFDGVRVGKGNGTLPNNTAIGFAVLDGYPASGDFVTGVGAYALQYNSSGSQNTAIGYAAMQLNTSGKNNTVSGVGVLRANTTGSDNTASGVNSMVSNTSGSSNSAVGISSLYTNSVGNWNTAVGTQSLYLNQGNSNTVLGVNGLSNKISGDSNIAIGNEAATLQMNGAALSSTIGSIYIGVNSRGYSNADYKAIVIGTDAVGEGANTTVIGTSSTVSTRLYGKTTTDSLQVNGNTVISGNTVLSGTVVLAQAQGDISMGAYQ